MTISKQNTGYKNRCYVDWFWNKPHTELEIDGTLHNLFLGGCTPTTSEEKQRIRATKGSGQPYVRFEIGLSSDEYEKLRESIENKQIPISTCSGAIASLLNRITKWEIPTITSLSTTGLAVHFLKDAKHPQSRISSIEIVDYKETKALSAQDEEIPEDLYQEELKNQEFGKKAPQIVHSEQGAVFENTARREDEKSEGKPTLSKTDSSITSGIDESEDEIDPPKTIDAIIIEGRYSDCCQVLQWMFTAAVLSVIFGSLLIVAGDTAAMLL